MVVRAARAEVHSAKGSWRRPACGPGARSRSADPRLRLDPLTPSSSSQAAPQHVLLGHENLENKADIDSRRGSPLLAFEPPPGQPKRHGQRPGSRASLSLGAKRTPEPTACSVPVETATNQSPSKRSLLRKRDCSRSSSASSAPAFEQLENYESEEGIDDLGGPEGSDEGSRRYCASSEEYVSDRSFASNAESDVEETWDPAALAKELSDLPELQAIDEAIAAKIGELKKIEAEQKTLNKRLEGSEQSTREAHKFATHLEVSLAKKEAELDIIAPHHAPRQGSVGMPKAPPLESLRPTQTEYDDITLSQVRSAMGLPDINKAN